MNKRIFYLLTFALIAGFFFHYYLGVQDYLVVPEKLERRITVLDRKGLPIKYYAPGEGHDWIPLKEIPVEMIDLLLLAEDKDYFRHSGVDFTSSLRSLWINLRSLSIKSGASTITQQVHRLAHQTPRNFTGKIRTLVGAQKLELNYSKAEILEYYLNVLPFGRNVAGVKMAAEIFFGKELHLLNYSEMAFLAILPRSPGKFWRKDQVEEIHRRKNELLSRYALQGLNQDVLEVEKKVRLSFQENKSSWDNYHFIQKILQNQDLYRHSVKGIVRTTLDLGLQKETSRIMREQIRSLKDLNVTHAAVVVMESATGDVLTYVGSADMDAQAGYFDALMVRRQPGSALKPLTYALALQSGHELNEVIPDIPSYYKTGLGQYLPRNYAQTFSGPRPMREALANSLNLPALAVADALGVEALYKFYVNMGLPLPKTSDHYGVGMTLGNVEITPMHLVSTYSAFSNGGPRATPRFFLEDPVQLRPTPLSEKAAFLIGDVLSDSVARREEFGENAFDLPFRFSVKTGTSTDFRDNWAVGFNSRYTVVVWVGNMNQAPMKKVSGVTGAGPILSKVAKTLMHEKFLGTPLGPAGVSKVQICALSGKKPTALCPHIKNEYLQNADVHLGPCDFHQEILVRECHEPGDQQKAVVSILPDLYQPFMVSHPEWSVSGQLASICLMSGPQYSLGATADHKGPAISRPLPGSIYAVDPNLPREYQKLKLELNQVHGIKNVRWKVNDKELSGSGPSADWPMEKGKHSFEADVEYEDGKTSKTTPLEVTVL